MSIKNKFVSWTLNVIREIEPPKHGVGINLSTIASQPPTSTSSSRIAVSSIHPTGPASKCLDLHDVITEVDGTPVDHAMTPQDVAKLIRGPEGSEVCVVVMRCGEKKEFRLRREPIGKMDDNMKTGGDGLMSGEKKDENEEELKLSESVEEVKDQVRRLSVEDLPVEFKNSDGEHKRQLAKSVESEETVVPIKDHDTPSRTDQFIQNQQHFALPTSTPPPPNRKSSFSSEQKSQDELDNISTPNSETSDHWELLSTTSIGSTAVLLSISGSISNSLRSVSPSFLVNNKFVLAESSGEEYLEHVVLPTDTLQGLCLAYKISATRLRMINGFSGNSLQLAPKKLRIPSPTTKAGIMIRTQDKTSREYKLYAFCAELISMELVEAKAYLDLSNWDLEEALRSAREDDGWNLRGEIECFGEDEIGTGGGDDALDAVARPKALTVNDVYAAPPPFEGAGFELKDISS